MWYKYRGTCFIGNHSTAHTIWQLFQQYIRTYKHKTQLGVSLVSSIIHNTRVKIHTSSFHRISCILYMYISKTSYRYYSMLKHISWPVFTPCMICSQICEWRNLYIYMYIHIYDRHLSFINLHVTSYDSCNYMNIIYLAKIKFWLV